MCGKILELVKLQAQEKLLAVMTHTIPFMMAVLLFNEHELRVLYLFAL